MPATRYQPSAKQVFISFARGLSIFTIVVYHLLELVPLPPLLAKANHLGGSGIYVFLFASSYGLYFSRITSWADFYLKRFKKVLLPYYVGITLIFIINQFVPLYPYGWAAFLSHLLLYKMFYEPYMQSFGPHFWFISTIVQFYLVWPLLLALASRWSSRNLLLAAFVVSVTHSILIYHFGLQSTRVWCSSVIQYSWILVLGLVAAKEGWFPRVLELGWLRYGALLVVGLGGAWLLNALAGERGNVFNDYFMFLSYFSFCVLFYYAGQRVSIINQFILWVESFSYSLYILHLVLLLIYMRAFGKTHLGLLEVPVLLAVFFGAALLFDKALALLLAPKFGRLRSA